MIKTSFCGMLYFCLSLLVPSIVCAYPSVYPTGTTIYKPEKCWNGYTIPSALGKGRAHLIDMNGNVVHEWSNFDMGFPYKVLPGGYIIGMQGNLFPDNKLIQVDWDGKVVWELEKALHAEFAAETMKTIQKMIGVGAGVLADKIWTSTQHHDYQREGSPVGYYAPSLEPKLKGKTLVDGYKPVKDPRVTIAETMVAWIYEADWDGKITWEWNVMDHLNELNITPEAWDHIVRSPAFNKLYLNSLSYLGPNKWYDAGDERFHPDNVIAEFHRLNILVIISKKTGKIVWQVGPDYNSTPEFRKLGWIMGPHHIHMIPKGLPGEGNILIYDNGGPSGFGPATPDSRSGQFNAERSYSRALEFNPKTFDIVWEYSGKTAGLILRHYFKIASPYLSSVQRLPNGNTMICEGETGRIIEVTREHEIVWEYINPFEGGQESADELPSNRLYRAYRIPYEWIPQLQKPLEKAVQPLPNAQLKINPDTGTIIPTKAEVPKKNIDKGRGQRDGEATHGMDPHEY